MIRLIQVFSVALLICDTNAYTYTGFMPPPYKSPGSEDFKKIIDSLQSCTKVTNGQWPDLFSPYFLLPIKKLPDIPYSPNFFPGYGFPGNEPFKPYFPGSIPSFHRGQPSFPGSGSNFPDIGSSFLGSGSGFPGSISGFSSSESRFPGSSSYFPSSGSSFPGSGSYLPSSGSSFPGSGSYFPSSGSSFPSSGSYFPSSGSSFPGSGSSFSSSTSGFPGRKSGFPSSNSTFPGSGSNFPNSGSNFPTSGSSFPTSGSHFPSSGSSFPSSGSSFSSSTSSFPGRESSFPGSSTAFSGSGFGFPSSGSGFLGSGSSFPGSGSSISSSGSGFVDRESGFPGRRSVFPGSGSDFQNSGSNFPGSASSFLDRDSSFPGLGSSPPESDSKFPGSGYNFPTSTSSFAGRGTNYPGSDSSFSQSANSFPGFTLSSSGYGSTFPSKVSSFLRIPPGSSKREPSVTNFSGSASSFSGSFGTNNFGFPNGYNSQNADEAQSKHFPTILDPSSSGNQQSNDEFKNSFPGSLSRETNNFPNGQGPSNSFGKEPTSSFPQKNFPNAQNFPNSEDSERGIENLFPQSFKHSKGNLDANSDALFKHSKGDETSKNLHGKNNFPDTSQLGLAGFSGQKTSFSRNEKLPESSSPSGGGSSISSFLENGSDFPGSGTNYPGSDFSSSGSTSSFPGFTASFPGGSSTFPSKGSSLPESASSSLGSGSSFSNVPGNEHSFPGSFGRNNFGFPKEDYSQNQRFEQPTDFSAPSLSGIQQSNNDFKNIFPGNLNPKPDNFPNGQRSPNSFENKQMSAFPQKNSPVAPSFSTTQIENSNGNENVFPGNLHTNTDDLSKNSKEDEQSGNLPAKKKFPDTSKLGLAGNSNAFRHRSSDHFPSIANSGVPHFNSNEFYDYVESEQTDVNEHNVKTTTEYPYEDIIEPRFAPQLTKDEYDDLISSNNNSSSSEVNKMDEDFDYEENDIDFY